MTAHLAVGSATQRVLAAARQGSQTLGRLQPWWSAHLQCRCTLVRPQVAPSCCKPQHKQARRAYFSAAGRSAASPCSRSQLRGAVGFSGHPQKTAAVALSLRAFATEAPATSNSDRVRHEDGVRDNPRSGASPEASLKAASNDNAFENPSFHNPEGSPLEAEDGLSTTHSPTKEDEDNDGDTSEAEESLEAEETVELELPPPTNVRVKTAEYITSSVKLEQCPPAKYPEFAVIGRSNVGKSSLINALTGKKGLAMVSKMPGKTRCINHFLINNSWYLVDLPGYGFAKRNKQQRLEWGSFTREFFLNRQTLTNVLLLVDASIPPMPIDLASVDWLGDSQVPFTIVFTKADKRKKKTPSPRDNMRAFLAQVKAKWDMLPGVYVTSATRGEGVRELLAYMAQLRELHNRARATAAVGSLDRGTAPDSAAVG